MQMKFRLTREQWLKMGLVADSGVIEVSQLLLERASCFPIDIGKCGNGSYRDLAGAIADQLVGESSRAD